MSNFFLSLTLAALMSFAAPVILIGIALGTLGIVSYFPGFLTFAHQGSLHILEFLAIFGNGKPLQGIMTIGFTVSVVGILLDMLNFYRYQSLRD